MARLRCDCVDMIMLRVSVYSCRELRHDHAVSVRSRLSSSPSAAAKLPPRLSKDAQKRGLRAFSVGRQLDVALDGCYVFRVPGDSFRLVDIGLTARYAAQPHHTVCIGVNVYASEAAQMLRCQLRLDFRRDGRVLNKGFGVRTIHIHVIRRVRGDRCERGADHKTSQSKCGLHIRSLLGLSVWAVSLPDVLDVTLREPKAMSEQSHRNEVIRRW